MDHNNNVHRTWRKWTHNPFYVLMERFMTVVTSLWNSGQSSRRFVPPLFSAAMKTSSTASIGPSPLLNVNVPGAMESVASFSSLTPSMLPIPYPNKRYKERIMNPPRAGSLQYFGDPYWKDYASCWLQIARDEYADAIVHPNMPMEDDAAIRVAFESCWLRRTTKALPVAPWGPSGGKVAKRLG
ncbi:hypothetical protein FA15DRAFT_500029 [Coprinopsis marcescibilis]|uniref:Uncharacterized protein n=1 Tax=Coprinopsis marcescibilis TaxID=230819 RepID=A0A5C3L3R4_COPMA|nr:hypothetical protein FA15DRAFT_500029 [Coprinopsis marcescibilis]